MVRFGIKTSHADSLAIRDEILRLEQLAADMEIVTTAPFSMDRIVDRFSSNAPILDDWHLEFRPVPCLVGISYGHPVLKGENRRVVTSEVHLISEELGCARTLSRWYRLGRPCDDGAKD